MFSAIAGFIKPLLGKDLKQTKHVPRVRPFNSEEDANNGFRDQIEDDVTLSTDDEKQQKFTTARAAPDDQMRLSIQALRHLVEQTLKDPEVKSDMNMILDRLEAREIKDLPFDTTSSLIEQLKMHSAS